MIIAYRAFMDMSVWMYTGALSGDVEWGGSFLFMGFVVSMLTVPLFVKDVGVYSQLYNTLNGL